MTILPNKRPANCSNDGENENTNNSNGHNNRQSHSRISSTSIIIQDGPHTQSRHSPNSTPPYEESPSSSGLCKRHTRPVRHAGHKRTSMEISTSDSDQSNRKNRTRKRKAREMEMTTTGTKSSSNNPLVSSQEDGEGCNSEDEYAPTRISEEEWHRRDLAFIETMKKRGLTVNRIKEDGACLFRAIAHQIFGSEDMHSVVRKHCMDYILDNSAFFSEYITEDINHYVSRKRNNFVHGNHLEIQAISAMYNRTIEVYCYEEAPINIFNGTGKHDHGPIRLSYQRGCHYNSIIDPCRSTVPCRPNYQPGLPDRKLFTDVDKASELSLIEQTMIEDKIAATDWEATYETIVEQATRESWALYVNDGKLRDPLAGCSSQGSSSTSYPTSRSPRSSHSSSSHVPTNRLSQATIIIPTSSSSSSRLTAAFNTRIPTPPNHHNQSPTVSWTQTSHHLRIPTPPIRRNSSPTLVRMAAGSPPATSQEPSSGNNDNFIYYHQNNTEPRMFGDFIRRGNNNVIETYNNTRHNCYNEDLFNQTRNENIVRTLPPEMFGVNSWDDDVDLITRVLAESQQEYIDSLKQATSERPEENNWVSQNPGPSYRSID